MDIKNVYESAKGEEFLSFDDWLRSTLKEKYEDFQAIPFPSNEYNEHYNNWIVAEQIIRHISMEDDVPVFVKEYGV